MWEFPPSLICLDENFLAKQFWKEIQSHPVFFSSGSTFRKWKKVDKKENFCMVFGTTVAFEIEVTVVKNSKF